MQTVYLVASGDLRLSANRKGWPAQEAMERQVIAAVEREGAQVMRAHAFDAEQGLVLCGRQSLLRSSCFAERKKTPDLKSKMCQCCVVGLAHGASSPPLRGPSFLDPLRLFRSNHLVGFRPCRA